MALKQFNVKAAQRWLQRLKTQDLQSYKDIIKFLRKYEKTDDEYDCYLKVSHTLLSHADLTKQINLFLQDGNRFVINKTEEEKLRDFMNHVQKTRPEVFRKIIDMIQELVHSKGEHSHQEASKMILPNLTHIIQGDQELQLLMKQAFQIPHQELIRKQNLEHLKNNRPHLILPDDPKDAMSQSNIIPHHTNTKPPQQSKTQFLSLPDKKEKLKNINLVGNLNSIVEERMALKQLEKSVERRQYRFIIKIMKLYSINLITKRQALDQVSVVGLNEVHFNNLQEIFQTREIDRRKQSWYKPLGDINFGNAERASPSYVTLPFFYPIQCSGKTPEIRALTNDKWLSVPYGSQQNENFSVRNKNINEINLLKAQDEKYELDLYMKRLTKAKQLFQRFLDQSNGLSQFQRGRTLRKAIDIGIIQFLYKNSKEEQKEQIQNFFRHYTQETCRMFKNRLENQIFELKLIRDVHAAKTWNQIASKNFYKALDLKSFQFRKNQKEKMKAQFFISQLNQRNKILANGGIVKQHTLSFTEKKDFFTIFNSFQSSSRMQKCHSRKLPQFQKFDLSNEAQKHGYPIMIMAFQDESICNLLYSMVIFYIDNSALSQSQKLKNRMLLDGYLVDFLGWQIPTKRSLSNKFTQQTLLLKLNNKQLLYNPKDYIKKQEQQSKAIYWKEDLEKQKKNMLILNDIQSKYLYLPRRDNNKKVLYSSQHFYCLSRFLYSIYERLIKMRQMSSSNQDLQLFQLLFYSNYKTKESIRFEQNLSSLFGKCAYMFSTMYKLFDNLLKSIVLSSNCLLTHYSFKIHQQNMCQEHQLLLINRFCLQHNLTSQKIVRTTYDQHQKVLYFNYFDSYYRSDEVGKDMNKKRSDISRNVQRYTVDDYRITGQSCHKIQRCFHRNEEQHLFQINSFKMSNYHSNQDLLVQKDRLLKNRNQKWSKEIIKARKINRLIH